MYSEILKMVKFDLGISSNKRDDYLLKYIEGAAGEISRKGITLDLESSDDMILLADYTAWVYRKRTENVPLSANLRLRLTNRRVKEGADRYAKQQQGNDT